MYGWLTIFCLAALSMTELNATGKNKYKNVVLRCKPSDNPKSKYNKEDDETTVINLGFSTLASAQLKPYQLRIKKRNVLYRLGKILRMGKTHHFIFELPDIDVFSNNDELFTKSEENKIEAREYLVFILHCIDLYTIQPSNIYIECPSSVINPQKNVSDSPLKDIKKEYLENINLEKNRKTSLSSFCIGNSKPNFVSLGNKIKQEADEAIKYTASFKAVRLKNDKVFAGLFNLTAFYENYSKTFIFILVLFIWKFFVINKNIGSITDSVKSIAWLPNILKRVMLVTWRL